MGKTMGNKLIKNSILIYRKTTWKYMEETIYVSWLLLLRLYDLAN
jgi:hypothetical protein